MKKYFGRIAICMAVSFCVGLICYVGAWYLSRRNEGEGYVGIRYETLEEVCTNLRMSYTEVYYDQESETVRRVDKKMPLSYAGQTEEGLEQVLAEYMKNPDKEDILEGLTELKIESFSKDSLEIARIYKQYGVASFPYYLKLTKGKLYVYRTDGDKLYVDTGVEEADLSYEEQKELKTGRYIRTEYELFVAISSYQAVKANAGSAR